MSGEMAERLDQARDRLRSDASEDARLLEVADVSALLGMRVDWIYREVRAGRLPHIRLGRYVRFRRESIEAWLASREHAAPPDR